MNEAALKQTSSLAGRQLKWRIARTYDADLLMKVCLPCLKPAPGLCNAVSCAASCMLLPCSVRL